MKGFIAKTVSAICFAGGGLAAGSGCYGYRDLVDPCYPQRYQFAARQETKAALAPQVQNGHVLDQTVWNYYFEPGTANLTPGGMDHLTYLAQRRPCPDPTVYLQVAHDIQYDPAAPDKYVDARNNLDTKRIQVIQDYLTAQTAGRAVAFNVVRHDPGEVGISATAIRTSITGLQNTSQAILTRPGGAGGGGAQGAAR
jgi:hypothetical protein